MVQADVVFLVDESWGFGQSSFSRVKDFISTIISSFKGNVVGAEGVRFGVTVFSDVPRLESNTDGESSIPHVAKNKQKSESVCLKMQQCSGNQPFVMSQRGSIPFPLLPTLALCFWRRPSNLPAGFLFTFETSRRRCKGLAPQQTANRGLNVLLLHC